MEIREEDEFDEDIQEAQQSTNVSGKSSEHDASKSGNDMETAKENAPCSDNQVSIYSSYFRDSAVDGLIYIYIYGGGGGVKLNF